MAPKKKKKPPAQPDYAEELYACLVEAVGPELVQFLGSNENLVKVRGVISTQCYSLDLALGRGGVPLARITVIHGPEASGKTTICLHLVAAAQAMGGAVLYIDKEYKLDPDYARALGVDLDKLIVSQPNHLEAVYEIIEKTVIKVKAIRKKTKTRVPVLIVLDSINACVTKAQLEGGFEDKHYAPQARVHSACIPKILPLVSREDIALVFIGQDRVSIGKLFGDPNELTGGNAVRYYASVIMKARQIGKSDDGGAQRTRVIVEKNQVAPPFQKAEFWIRHGVGIDSLAGLAEAAEELGVVVRSTSKAGKTTSWYEYPPGGPKVANGKEQLRNLLENETAIRREIEKKVERAIRRSKRSKKKKKKAKPKGKKAKR